ncbi:putative ribonuclease H-like domain-containing protein [Tanacetum coccineum]
MVKELDLTGLKWSATIVIKMATLQENVELLEIRKTKKERIVEELGQWKLPLKMPWLLKMELEGMTGATKLRKSILQALHLWHIHLQEVLPAQIMRQPKQKEVNNSWKRLIKTGTLDFDNVYFCKELKYNLFSVSQICDKKNNVLFTDTECLVLSSDFKLLDESQVLLRVPRKDNIYSVDLKSVVPTKGLTCLFAKATIDESNLWHRRLGHINFKNMNKLVRGNLVRGLPSKIFENDHSCVACQKGKQHKASFVTDDFSRFSWVFFLATKDETSRILKTFITEIENQLDYKVKVIRSDNGTEFKNSVMNQFCEMKGIKRECYVARILKLNVVPNVFSIDDTGIFGNAYDDEEVGVEAGLNNLETTMNVSPILTTGMSCKRAIGTKWFFRNNKDEKGIVIRNIARLVTQGYTQEEGIDYDEVFALVARIEAIRLFLAYASFMGFIVYQMDVKSTFLYGTIEKELLKPGWVTKKSLCDVFEGLMHKRFQMSSIGELTFFLGLQVQHKEDGIFISQDKYVAELLKKFDFATMKTASTLMEPNKALVKDEEVDM